MTWIIDRRTDLVWFIGSALSSLLFLAILLASARPVWIWFLWAMFLDTPHYFGTYLRTYFDPAKSPERRRLCLTSLGLLGVGPLVIGLCALLRIAGLHAWHRPFEWLVLAFDVWAYWHLVRQHIGIAALYRRRSQERALEDRRADEIFLYTFLLGAFVLLVLGHPESRAALGLEQTSLWVRWMPRLVTLALFAAAGFFVARQRARVAEGLPLNFPKLLFVVAVTGSYLFLCTYRPGYRLPLLVWTGTITIAHNLQYFGLVWFHHQNRRKHVRGGGVFGLVGRHWTLFFGCALVVGVALRGLGSALGLFPGWPPTLIHSGAHLLFGTLTLRDLFFSVVLGIAMHHYYLDQVIWHPGRDRELARDLGL